MNKKKLFEFLYFTKNWKRFENIPTSIVKLTDHCVTLPIAPCTHDMIRKTVEAIFE